MSTASDSRSDLAHHGLEALGLLHRWAGILFCIPFVLWFISGAVMVFVPFPSLDATERAARSAIIDLGRVRVSPGEAVATAGGADGLRLLSVAGRPAYVVALPAWPLAVFGADDGQPLRPLSASQAKAVAEAFGRAAAVKVDGPIGYDQWIVSERYDALRPYYRVRLTGPQAEELYVSVRTGEVVQRTRASERFWNWPGAVVHWLYMTPLRKSADLWALLVGWLSLAAALTALLGLVLGLVRVADGAPRTEEDEPGGAWLEWHYLIGLIGGVFVLAWAFSGWLSVSHGKLSPPPETDLETLSYYAGMPITDAAGRVTLQDIGRLGPSTEVQISALGGEAFAAAAGGGRPPRVVLAKSVGPALSRLPDDAITRAVRSVLPTEPGPVEPVRPGDFYASALGLPASAVMLRIPTGERIYVDAQDGRLLNALDNRAAGFTWVTYGLHGLRFPGLIERPWLRKVLILVPLLLGFVLSLSSVVVAVRRLLIVAQKRKRRRRNFGVKVLQRSLDH